MYARQSLITFNERARATTRFVVAPGLLDSQPANCVYMDVIAVIEYVNLPRM